MRVFHAVPMRCISLMRVKLLGIVVELYNDSNEVSALINFHRSRSLPPPLLPSLCPSAFNSRASHEQSRKFQRDGRFKIASKTNLSSGVAKLGLASNYSAVPFRCRRFLGTTEIRYVLGYVLPSASVIGASSASSTRFPWPVDTVMRAANDSSSAVP